MKVAAEKAAATAYVLPALAVGGIWYIVLFVGNVPNPNYGEMLRLWFFEDPKSWFFWALATVQVICLALAVMYFSKVATQKSGAIALAVIGITTAVGSWLTFDSSIAILVTLPLLFSIPRAWHLTTSSSRP